MEESNPVGHYLPARAGAKNSGARVEDVKELFQGKLRRVGSELVIPKESLGLEGTENYFRQTVHFELQA
ncbi:MAG: hypothetical protein HYT97_00260 [Elusimicrobia bacterium]|nr:hypothetical protein [Elusimicrobiota bacterium]